MAFLILKWLHVLSATVFFGTGIAFFLLVAWRRGEVHAFASVARITVLADALFTAPAVVVQLLTGIGLVHLAGWPWSARWIAASLVLYGIVVACWLPVLWLQLRVRDLACAAAADGTPLPPACHRLMRRWFALGWPAFLAMLAIFWLMLARPA